MELFDVTMRLHEKDGRETSFASLGNDVDDANDDCGEWMVTTGHTISQAVEACFGVHAVSVLCHAICHIVDGAEVDVNYHAQIAKMCSQFLHKKHGEENP
jgi:hypothetical protein